MLKHARITEERARQALARMERSVYGAAAPLRVEAYHVRGEPIPIEDVAGKAFEPFRVGDCWGAPWDTTWFRCTGSVPAAWRGMEVVALVRLTPAGGKAVTAEGLVWRGGQPLVALTATVWEGSRSEVPVADRARGGEPVDFLVEAAANPGQLCHGPGAVAGRGVGGGEPLCRLAQAELAVFNREAFEALHDFRVALRVMEALPAESARRGQLRYALNVACDRFDEGQPAWPGAVREALREVLSRRNSDTVHRVSAVGHAHIDTAWLWPLREAARKCARTFATALLYMERYPEYVFGCSQAQHYAWMRDRYPTLYHGIRRAVRRGQWEPLGAMWVEPDCNVPSGESLVRQILLGKRFFHDEFGVDATTCWLPDAFGFNAALPQILAKAGVKYFLSQKISWNELNRFPHHTFLWEGIDGSRVFAHFPPADTYNGNFEPAQVLAGATNFLEHDRATRSLYVYGYGDGGGGPTVPMLETARRVKDLEGLPLVRQEKAAEFFAKAERDVKDPPVWVGELYFERHRGTYTTQARNKRGNRKSEVLLHDAELLDAVAGAAGLGPGRPLVRVVPRAAHDAGPRPEPPTAQGHLDRAWRLVLLNQFHDIIPGSSINWVYADSTDDYVVVHELGGAVLRQALERLAAAVDTSGCGQPFIVVNTTGQPRAEVIDGPTGRPVFVRVPPCGYAAVDAAAPRPLETDAQPVRVEVARKRLVLDNGILQAVIDAAGDLVSLVDLRCHREVIPPGNPGNVFQLFKDHPNNWEAWDADIFHRETHTPVRGLESVTVEEQTPWRATLKIVRAFGRSRLAQRVILTAGSPMLLFETEVDWRESHRFLKVAFPVTVRAPRATYEIQFGALDRPTHDNTSWDLAMFEVPAQRWADLAEGDFGVALLNDCKYGYDIRGEVMRLSLLRAPAAPDPEADRGEHRFTYAVAPHAGTFRDGAVVALGQALNTPLHAVSADPHPGSLPPSGSFFAVDRPGLVIDTVKRAEHDNALIVRLYEAHGTRGPATLQSLLPFRDVHLTNLMERNLRRLDWADGEVRFEVGPFEIVTLKFGL